MRPIGKRAATVMSRSACNTATTRPATHAPRVLPAGTRKNRPSTGVTAGNRPEFQPGRVETGTRNETADGRQARRGCRFHDQTVRSGRIRTFGRCHTACFRGTASGRAGYYLRPAGTVGTSADAIARRHETVEQQHEDVPRDMVCYTDSEGNTYDFAFGLDWKGVIRDARVENTNSQEIA